MEIVKNASGELAEGVMKQLKNLERLITHSAPGRGEEATKLISEIETCVSFSKTSGLKIGACLKKLAPTLKRAKQYNEVVKGVAKVTGYDPRTIRNWVNPKPEPVEKISTPSPASAKDLAYRLYVMVYDKTRQMSDKEFDDLMRELWLTVEYRRGKRRTETLTISGVPKASRYELDGTLKALATDREAA